MQYKSMILELLHERPNLHLQLRSNRTLLATVNRLASELREAHLAWKERLVQGNPGTSLEQRSLQAMELALHDLEASLPSESPPSDEEFPLDEAMAFIRLLTG